MQFITGFLIGITLFLVVTVMTNRTYMDGQIDAINGNIQYHLVEQPDGTVKWEYCDDGSVGNTCPDNKKQWKAYPGKIPSSLGPEGAGDFWGFDLNEAGKGAMGQSQ